MQGGLHVRAAVLHDDETDRENLLRAKPTAPRDLLRVFFHCRRYGWSVWDCIRALSENKKYLQKPLTGGRGTLRRDVSKNETFWAYSDPRGFQG